MPQFQFKDDTAEAPQVYRWSVKMAQKHLRSSEVKTLNVVKMVFINSTGTSKVNDLDTRLPKLFEHDVLWFQISMDYVVLLQVDQTSQELNSDTLVKLDRTRFEVI
jgi:hypothetical protein